VRQCPQALTEHLMGTDAAALGVEAAVGAVTGAVALARVTVAATSYAGRRLQTLPPTAAE